MESSSVHRKIKQWAHIISKVYFKEDWSSCNH